MKIVYTTLYIISVIIFLTAVLGKSMTRPLFTSLSEKTIESSGFKKSYVEAVDNQIDELIYKSKQIELQIEKLKKFFSSEKVDESKYQKESNLMLEKTFYSPLVGMFSFVYRIMFVFISIIILMFAVIFHFAYRSFDLRRRVKRLEEMLLASVPG